MKAIRVHKFGDTSVLKLEDIKKPTPQKDQLLIKLEAIGVNPVDTYIRSGNYPNLPQLPYTPGIDGSGTVVETGQKVYLSGSLTGTYAEYCLASPDQIHPLPPNCGFLEGAALGVPAATAYHALFHKGNLQAGQKVLVRGASGAVGLSAVQLAKGLGAQVTGTASSEKGLRLVKDQGADEVCSHNDTVGSFDLILEMLANSGLQKDFEQTALRGTIVIVGNRGEIAINPRTAMSVDATIKAMTLGNATREERQQINDGLYKALENSTLRPIIRQTYRLTDVAQAHTDLLKPGAAGKLVLVTFAHH